MIRITTDTTATTMEAGITATGVDMREEVGIGIITRMAAMKIVATIEAQIVPVAVAGDASLFPL
jgi:hypothetical protein